MYDINIEKWAKASIADNCNVNVKVATIMELPHVGCSNHKLNLDINDWIESDSKLNETIEDMKKDEYEMK